MNAMVDKIQPNTEQKEKKHRREVSPSRQTNHSHMRWANERRAIDVEPKHRGEHKTLLVQPNTTVSAQQQRNKNKKNEREKCPSRMEEKK